MLTTFHNSPCNPSERHIYLCALQGNHTMEIYVEDILEMWHGATLTDYAHVLLAVVVIAWFIARNDK
jgi:hypothetical protein